MQDRTTGSLILAPSIIRLTKDNTTDLKVDGRRVIACTAMIEYKKGIYMYLPLIVYSGIVKTVYFDTHKTKTGLLYSEKKRRIKEKEQTKDTGGERTQSGGITQDVEAISRDMGGEKKWRWKELFRNFKNWTWRRGS